MVALKGINYGTRYCIFSIDSSSDLSSLPTQTSPGKGTLSTIRSCSMGSIAQAVDGNTYILTYSGNASSPETGGTVDIAVEPISEAQIYSLFDN